MTEFQNAQAINAASPNDCPPAPEDQTMIFALPPRAASDLPLPSGGDAGPIARKAAQPSPPSRSATIGSDAEREATELTDTTNPSPLATNSPATECSKTREATQETTRANIGSSPIREAPASTSSAQAEPIAIAAAQTAISARSATIPSSDGQTAIRHANPIDATRSAISSAQAEPIASTLTQTRGRPRSATKPGRKPRAISGQHAAVPQKYCAADSNPSGRNAGYGGHSRRENQLPDAAVNLPSGDGGASGHVERVTHSCSAARKTKRRQSPRENHLSRAAPGCDGDAKVATEPMVSSHPVTAILIPLVRRHSQWHSAWMRLVLQGRAIGRGAAGGDKKAGSKLYDDAVAGTLAPEHFDLAVTLRPLIIATERLAIEIAPIDKAIEKTAKMHPLWPWAKEVYGIGPGSLGKLIAQAHSPAIEDRDGNPRTPAFEISDYRSVAGLWKRFGLAVINGERQRMKSGIEGIEHAYAPRRRALMWNVGGGLIGFMQKGPRPLVGEDVEARDDLSPYQKLFVARLRSEAERDPAMRLPDVIKNGIAKESYKTHASNRARRYVEKRFLRHLYAAAQAVAGRDHGRSEGQPRAVAPLSNSVERSADGRGQTVYETQKRTAAPSLSTALFSGRGPYLVGERGPELFVPESNRKPPEKPINERT